MTHKQVARLAWQLYGLRIPVGERRPREETFYSYLKKSPLAPLLKELLEGFGIQKRRAVRTVSDKAILSFRQALAEMRSSVTPIRPIHVANRAYDIYCNSLSRQEPCPARKTFKALVCSGGKSNPTLMAMLKEAGVEKRMFPAASPENEPIRGRHPAPAALEAGEVVKALREAVAEKMRPMRDRVKNGNKKPKLAEIMRAGFEIYRGGSSKREELQFREFRKFAEDQLLAGLIRSQRKKHLSREMLLDAFRKALAILKTQRVNIVDRRLRPQNVANLAYDIYCRRLPSNQASPRVGTFRNLVSGKSADEDILKLLQQSCIISLPRRNASN